jgi:hypothetical protein
VKKPRSVTAEEIIQGALGTRRPKVRFPGLSHELEHQARSLVEKHESTHIRRGASPFVESILSKKWRRS